MRICFICNQIAAWGKIGGFGTNTRRLGTALSEAGVDVHVVVPRRPGQRRIESLDGMTVHGLSLREVFFGLRIYRTIDADIYHVEEPSICGYLAQKAMPDRVHLVTSMDPRDSRDWWIEFKYATWSRRLKYPVQHFYENGWLVHRSVSAADGVYVEAEFLREKTRKLYGLTKSPGLLPKPVPVPKGPFQKASRPLCLLLGRFDPRKRPEYFFRLAQRMPEIDFIAIGKAHDSAYQRHLEGRYSHIPNLELSGFIDPFTDERMNEILSKAWILIHPAAREGLPSAFQEASSHEMAILAFVDPANYVSNFGMVVQENGSIDALEEHLRRLLDSDVWRQKGRAGREYNLKHHAIDVSVSRHMAVYRSFLEKH
jgi:glycosyltransferase involved in cell wall biosynthesis